MSNDYLELETRERIPGRGKKKKKKKKKKKNGRSFVQRSMVLVVGDFFPHNFVHMAEGIEWIGQR